MCKVLKRKVVLLLSVMLLLTLVACSKDKNSKDDVATGTDSFATTENTEEKTTDSDANTEAKNIDFKISVDINELDMKVGDSQKVVLSVTPEDEEHDIVWSADAVAVVAVSDGEIKAIAPGECVVSAKIKGTDESVDIKVIVNAEEEESSDTNKDSDAEGKDDEKNSDDVNNTTNDNNSNSNNNSNAGNNTNSGNDSNAVNNSNAGNSNAGNGSNSTTATTTEVATEEITEATTEAQAEGYHLDYSSTVLALVNAERAKVGVAPLSLDYTLMSAANVRAKECSVSFSHTRPDGSSCFTAWNVSYGAVGENIAAGYGSA